MKQTHTLFKITTFIVFMCLFTAKMGAQVPANDLCSNAIPLAVPISTTGTTINATVESPFPPSCVATQNTMIGVWYTVIGTGNKIGASLCGTSWDSEIFIYSGNSCGALTCVTADDDNGVTCSGSAASAAWCSVPGLKYYIYVTGWNTTNAFTLDITETVNSGSAPTLTVVASSPTVCLAQSATVTASGASSYFWYTGATTAAAIVTPTATTVYTVYGVGSTGCDYALKTVTLTSLTTTVTVPASTASICPGGSFVITPGGATTYTYTGPSFTTTGTSATVSPIVSTSYTVVGTGTNGCKSTTGVNSPTVVITTLASPAITLTAVSPSICPGITTTLTATGANSYTWTAPSSNASFVTVNPLVTTIYTVTGTGTTVCNGVKTFTLFAFLTPSITVNSNTVCSGSVFTLTPSGASTYTYSNGSNTIAPTSNTTINVSGTSANGCVSNVSAVSTLTTVTLPVVTVNSGTVCKGAIFVMTPSGATSYTFINASNPATPSVTTTYSVIGSTTVGCASLPALATVTVYALPVVSIAVTPTSMVLCNNDVLSLTGSGALTYNWNNNASGTTYTSTPSSTSSYFVVGTDVNGCTGAATISFTVNPSPALALTGNTFVCLGNSTTLTATGTGLTYSWTATGSASTAVVSPVVNTVYGVTGTNTLGCTTTKTLAVTVNSIVVTASSNTAICINGAVSISAPGANSYTWMPVANPVPFNAITVSPTITTTYTYVAVDSKACSHTGMITVTVNPLPVINATGGGTICVGESATITASGASTYVWNDATNSTASSLTVNPTSNTTYMVAGTDAHGCVSTGSVVLTVSKCTGINKIESEIVGLSVYPNPNNGEFTVELNNGLNKTIEVSDLTGRVILATQTQNDKTVVNLNNFANGVYYVKIQSNKSVEVMKVVKH